MYWFQQSLQINVNNLGYMCQLYSLLLLQLLVLRDMSPTNVCCNLNFNQFLHSWTVAQTQSDWRESVGENQL